ncbi:hypothetical protein AXX12_07915 [Anaerosporomusa subterranea]|uniref:SAF domain-containing protein n=1 Tax=Anaerosporomusa subterranea TaxID=1794912 RepID=A0A154BQY1_ANASB|nr:flagellar basal body P-ring formation chaperone FlgA [Anaerosporomusa subterranea]KYZ76352.1 hypothetical protein AXX12_07915 [Anaerosporomusa subterranea]
MLKRVAALILAALFLLSTICYSAVRVSIKNEALITGPQITLGDIALIEGDDVSQIAALQKITLGSAPLPGATTLLSREILTSRLAASQIGFSGVEWGSVPEMISIAAGGQVLSGQTLADTALAKLKAKLPVRPQEELSISLLKEIPDLVAPLGVLNYEIAGQSVRFGVPQTAYLIVSADGVLFSRMPIKYEIKRFTSVVTATTAIAARETLSPDTVRLSWMEVSRLPAGYLTSLDQTNGLVVKRSLSAGSVIYSAHLDKPVLIKRGTAVIISATYGGVEAAAPGIAQNDGRNGQLISVRNTATGRLVTARVVDKGRVEVSLYEHK